MSKTVNCISFLEKNDSVELEKLNVDLIKMTNYLISLYFATGKKYHCTRTNLSKLMSIVAFVYPKGNNKLFEDEIYKYDGCGTIIPKIKFFYDMVLYETINCNNNKERIVEPIIYSDDIPGKYLDFDGLNNDVKLKIEDVFRQFGSYTAFDLGQCINQIINFPNVVKNNKIDLSIISSLRKEDFNNIINNRELIDYLF